MVLGLRSGMTTIMRTKQSTKQEGNAMPISWTFRVFGRVLANDRSSETIVSRNSS